MFIEDQITADILACGLALCLLGQPLDICERAEITSGLAARQAPGIGVFGCSVEGELTRDRAPIFVGTGSGRLDHISFAPKKHEIDQEFSFKNSFQPRFWRRGKEPILKIQKSPRGVSQRN